MGKYSAAAHKAAMVAEQQADQLPCIVPSNNLLYCFLREVKAMRIAEAVDRRDNLASNLKIALDNLQQFPLRIYDAKSAQEVKGIGSAMANIIREELFAAYPPEEPGESELEQLQNARAALRVAQAAKKRRNVIANAPPSLPAQIRRTSFDHEPPMNLNTMAGPSTAPAAAAAAPGRGKGKKNPAPTAAAYTFPGVPDHQQYDSMFTFPAPPRAAPVPASDNPLPKLPKPKNPYTPGIGTANYAFLIVLLQAHRGPERKEFLTKDELSSRAEASGLSDKPINAEPIPRGGFNNQNSRNFYNGWSNFKKLVNEGLVTDYSNPKKIKLTLEGYALAERLYRDAVARGRVNPVPGLPVDGPFQFQQEEGPQNVAAAARAAQDAAGLIHGALPSAALRRPSSLNRTGSGPVPGSNLPSLARTGSGYIPTGSGTAPSAAPTAATAAAMRRVSGEGSSPYPVLDTFDSNNEDEDNDDPLEMSLAQRLNGRGRGKSGGGGGGRAAQAPSRLGSKSNPGGVTAKGNGPIFLDLAGDSSDGEDDNDDNPMTEDYVRIPRPAEERKSQKRKHHRVSDEHVAMMMEMGFSDTKARKALRKSMGSIEDAVEIVTVMSSAGGEESSEEEEEIEQHVDMRRKEIQVEPTIDAALNTNNNTNNNSRAVYRATAAAGAAAAAAAAGVPLSRQPSSTQNYRNLNLNNGGTNGRGHIRTGSQPTSRPRLDPNSQSQPDYLTSSEPQSQPTGDDADAGGGTMTKSWWVQENDIRLPPLSLGRRFIEEYEVVLLVDGREQYSRNTGGGANASRTDALQAHLTRMRGAGLAVEHRTLPIGDALWVARSRRNPSTEYVLDYILERKSLTDLLSSIKDSNRYTSQKYFLNRSGLKNLYYLIEGDPEILPNPRDVKTIKSAAGSTEIIDGFRILRTKGVQETFRLYQSLTEAIVHLYSNLTRNTSFSTNNTTTSLTFDGFKDHMRDVNQGSTTLHDIWGRMLVEIPGLGPEGAAAILNAYPVPRLLWSAYRKALQSGIASGRGGAVVAEELLVGIRGENGGRALGPDKAKKVFQALFMNHWNLQSV